MKTQDEALTLSNPRLLSAVYFSLLAIIATIAIDTVLYNLGVEQLLPISEEIFLAVIVAALFGALFGERIVHSERPYRKHVFFWAFFMVIAALPVYNLGFISLLRSNHASLFNHASLTHVMYLYLLILVYSFVLAGIWLAIAAGLAALYLRGYLEYYILQSLYQRHKNPKNEVVAKSLEKSIQPKERAGNIPPK